MARKKSKGLGDTIKKVTSAVGIKPCEGCERRAELLNKIFPYKVKPEPFDDGMKLEWKEFKDKNLNVLQDAEMNLIQNIYNMLNGTAIQPCRHCSSANWNHLINNIDEKYQKETRN